MSCVMTRLSISGSTLYDREPARIRARQIRRDADLEDDDFVKILIDSFHDRRGRLRLRDQIPTR